MLIKSPKASTVMQVRAAGPVRKGEVLLLLSDIDEVIIQSKIMRSIEENHAKLEEAQAEVKSRAIEKSLFESAGLLEQAAIQCGRILSIKNAEFEQGTETETAVKIAEKRALMSGIKFQQAKAELEIHSRNMQDAPSIYTLVDKVLWEEYELVQEYIRRLAIKSPFDGVFLPYVDRGNPVELGHILGEINE
jgi:multidrug resistance efflux pump